MGEGEGNGSDTRLKAAETVAINLGELVEDSIEALEDMPWWRPANRRRWEVVGGLKVGRTLYTVWREAFDL